MLLYYLFWGCLIGIYMLFYIIFGTNLLTKGPMPVSVFLPILEFCRKGIPNGVQTEWNLHGDLSWTESNPKDLDLKSRTPRGGHEAGGRAPHPRGPLIAPPVYFFRIYPQTTRSIHENTFPSPQPSVPVRSHLGAFSGDLPEGESITEGFYINTIFSPMKHE